MGIERVGVIGCGLMGSGIAEVCARAGLDVMVREVDAAAAEAGRQRLVTSLDRGVTAGKLTEPERDEALAEAARVLAPGGLLLISNFAPGTDLGHRPGRQPLLRAREELLISDLQSDDAEVRHGALEALEGVTPPAARVKLVEAVNARIASLDHLLVAQDGAPMPHSPRAARAKAMLLQTRFVQSAAEIERLQRLILTVSLAEGGDVVDFEGKGKQARRSIAGQQVKQIVEGHSIQKQTVEIALVLARLRRNGEAP